MIQNLRKVPLIHMSHSFPIFKFGMGNKPKFIKESLRNIYKLSKSRFFDYYSKDVTTEKNMLIIAKVQAITCLSISETAIISSVISHMTCFGIVVYSAPVIGLIMGVLGTSFFIKKTEQKTEEVPKKQKSRNIFNTLMRRGNVDMQKLPKESEIEEKLNFLKSQYFIISISLIACPFFSSIASPTIIPAIVIISGSTLINCYFMNPLVVKNPLIFSTAIFFSSALSSLVVLRLVSYLSFVVLGPNPFVGVYRIYVIKMIVGLISGAVAVHSRAAYKMIKKGKIDIFRITLDLYVNLMKKIRSLVGTMTNKIINWFKGK